MAATEVPLYEELDERKGEEKSHSSRAPLILLLDPIKCLIKKGNRRNKVGTYILLLLNFLDVSNAYKGLSLPKG